jgi:hypothetical protein
LGWEAKIGLEELVVEMVAAARDYTEPTAQGT